ncbi:MAG: LysM peptidoglycan-binding domain-containing protein, partial [Candidatus Spyradocola sp.]
SEPSESEPSESEPSESEPTESTPSQPSTPGPVGTPTPSRPSTPACPNGVLYTVRAGDTLRAIAQRFDVTLDALMSANPGQTNNRLIIGQQLCIPQAICPACCAAGDTAVRIRSTNFVDYLVTYNISYAALSAANPGVDLDALTPGRQLCIPPIDSRGRCADNMGTLELSGDFSAQALAEQLRTTVSALMRSNPTYTPRDFTRGRIICVPPAMN